MPYIRVNGIRLAFDAYGDMNKPPLFAVHGLTSCRMSLEALLTPEVAKNHYVILYDCRGHGQSDKPAAFTLEDHGRDLLALIDTLGYDQADVLGISMGSYIVMQAAVLDSSKINHLIAGVGRSYDEGYGSSTAAYLKRKGVELSEITQEEMDKLLDEAFWSPFATEEQKQKFRAAGERMRKNPNYVELTPENRAAISASLKGFDLRPQLPGIQCKALAVSARYDGLNPMEYGQEIAGLIPGCRMEIMEKSGHMSTSEERERWVEMIESFLAE